VHQIDTGHHLEQLASHMNRASVAAGPHVDLGRISPGIGDELGNGLGRNGWVDQHHIGRAKQSRDWRDVANEIEIKLFVERRVDRVPGRGQQQRVTVGRRSDDDLGGDIAAGPSTVLDHERLTEPLRQPLARQTREDVAPSSGGKADDQAHRPPAAELDAAVIS
jgi:hypothetical protein